MPRRWFQIIVCMGLAGNGEFCVADDVFPETSEIDVQIQKLDESPIAKKMAELNKEFEKVMYLRNGDMQKVHKEMSKLRETPEWKTYSVQRDALENKREAPRDKEINAFAQAAKELYAARHKELLTHAAGELVEAKKLEFYVLNYPRVDGSTSTQPLAVILASRLLGVPYEWVYAKPHGYHIVRPPYLADLVMPGGTGGIGPGGRDFSESDESHDLELGAARLYAKPADNQPAQVRIGKMINSLLAVNNGTHESYVNVIENKADLVLVAREPSADEMKLAKEKGVTLRVKPIALDALVFIVNHKSPVKNMTLDQIRTLYRTTARSDAATVDRNQQYPLFRDKNSGSRELFDKLVMKGEALPDPKRAWQHDLYTGSMSGPFNRVTAEENALAYSVYYYERYMAMSVYTRTIAIENVEATTDNIASGKYPLASPVYAVVRDDEAADSPAMKLFNWLGSDEGKKVIRESGYVVIEQK